MPASALVGAAVLAVTSTAGLEPAPTIELAYQPNVDHAVLPLRIGLAAARDDAAGTATTRPGERGDSSAGTEIPAATGAAPFGTAGSLRVNLQAGYAFQLSMNSNDLGIAGASLSWFIEDDLSLELELNAMYVDQSGSNALGLNFNLLLRWHFVSEPTWSLFLDGGAGMLGTTEPVPKNGSNFNFTPQAGAGFTLDIGHDTRLVGGVRWQHISNANLSNPNPGRDSLLTYVGVSLPY